MPDVTSIPVPEGDVGGVSWSVIILTVTISCAAVSGIWTAFINLRIKKVDNSDKEKQLLLEQERANSQARQLAETAKEQKKWEIELEKLKMDFARQQKFQDDLIAANKEEKQYTRELMEALRIATDTIASRDATIRERDRENAELSRKINELERRVEELTRHVRSLEQTRAQNEQSPE